MKKSVFTLSAAALSVAAVAAVGTKLAEQLPAADAPLAKYELKTTADRQVAKVFKAKAIKAAANVSDYQGRNFIGALTSSDYSFDGPYETKYSYGLVKSTIGSNEVTPIAINTSYYFQAGSCRDGKYFGVYPMTIMGAFNGTRYITIDANTGAELKNIVNEAGTTGYSTLPCAMAIDPTSNKFYAMQYNEDLTGLDWRIFNDEYDSFDMVAKFRGQYNVLTLAATPDGEMYFINMWGDLYQIDKSNGRATLINYTGVTPINYVQSMGYDNRTGKFLWAAMTSTGSSLYAVDPATAATEKILDFANGEQYASFEITDNLAADAAPAAVDDLKLTYTGNGALSGAISFTAPSTTFNSAALSGSNEVYVYVDGEVVRSGAVTSGEAVTVNLDLTEGNHYVAVNTKNAAGFSPLASFTQYAGYDTPLAVGDLAFDVADGKCNLSWTAPTGGVNGGYVDFDNITYTITRLPDNVVVATGLKAITFSEKVPAEMHNYSYVVKAVNNGHNGVEATTKSIICGDAFSVPYYQSFADEGVFEDFFTVVDVNGDAVVDTYSTLGTWHRNAWNGTVTMDLNPYNNITEGDDWLISPAITMQGGTTYRFTFNMRTYSAGYTEDFELLVGTNPSDLTSFKCFHKAEKVDLPDLNMNDYSALFNVEVDGNYYVAIRYLSKSTYTDDPDRKSSFLVVTSFAVDCLGQSKAPKAATDVVVTRDANDELKALVEFTAPTFDLEGNTLASLEKINIYRNDELVHTMANPAPGAKLLWNDENVATPGLNKYSVVAANAYGEGEPAVGTAFIAAYKAPYSESFSSQEDYNLYTKIIVGASEDQGYSWKYNGTSGNCSMWMYNMTDTTSIDNWFITPKFALDENSVYEFSYDINQALTKDSQVAELYKGTDAAIESMTTKVADLPRNTNYQYMTVNNEIVTTGAEKCHFGLYHSVRGQYDYISVNLDNIGLRYVKSALSPHKFTRYQSAASANGELIASLSFNAPNVDYQGNTLTEKLKVEVFRNGAAVPVYSQSEVSPGAQIKWKDTEPMKGRNAYVIVASNSYGKSEAVVDTLYVGRDVPNPVADLTAKGVNENQDILLSWTNPTEGSNGGVIVSNELKFNIYQHDATTQENTLIAENVAGSSYTVVNEAIDYQEVRYYAVEPVNTEGKGAMSIAMTQVGKLFSTPFKESFANKEITTNPWIIVTANSTGYTWGVSNPSGATYNNATPQDNDGGCAYMYNGSYYAQYTGAAFISPKVKIAAGDELGFYLYHYATKYPDAPGRVLVMISYNDRGYEQVGEIIFDSTEETGWMKHVVDLSKYEGGYINFAFYGLTNGSLECIYLDNIEISGTVGVDAVGVDEVNPKDAKYYDIMGRNIAKPENGFYIMSDGKNAMKVVK